MTWTVVGQDAAVAVLTGAVAHERVAHAYLFAGPAHVGKTLAALQFAQLLNCTALASDDPRPAAAAAPASVSPPPPIPISRSSASAGSARRLGMPTTTRVTTPATSRSARYAASRNSSAAPRSRPAIASSSSSPPRR